MALQESSSIFFSQTFIFVHARPEAGGGRMNLANHPQAWNLIGSLAYSIYRVIASGSWGSAVTGEAATARSARGQCCGSDMHYGQSRT